MKDKKVSIRIVFPFVMSVPIAVCIISCMFLFSHYFSGYFQRDTIEKVSKQKKTLSQDLEAEIENINVPAYTAIRQADFNLKSSLPYDYVFRLLCFLSGAINLSHYFFHKFIA
jgi:hypothetical protein